MEWQVTQVKIGTLTVLAHCAYTSGFLLLKSNKILLCYVQITPSHIQMKVYVNQFINKWLTLDKLLTKIHPYEGIDP